MRLQHLRTPNSKLWRIGMLFHLHAEKGPPRLMKPMRDTISYRTQRLVNIATDSIRTDVAYALAKQGEGTNSIIL